jgi:hypothetical protein
MTKISGTLDEDRNTFVIISLLILPQKETVSDEICKTHKIHTECQIHFPPKIVPFER